MLKMTLKMTQCGRGALAGPTAMVAWAAPAAAPTSGIDVRTTLLPAGDGDARS